MNQSQLKYVKLRAEAIYNDKKKALREEHTTEAKLITNEEKLNAILTGDFTIMDKPRGSFYRPSWWQYVNFHGEVIGGLNNDTYTPAAKILEDKFTQLMDELVLGDNRQALELLKAFENE